MVEFGNCDSMEETWVKRAGAFCVFLCCVFLLSRWADAAVYIDQIDNQAGISMRTADSNLTKVLRSQSLTPMDKFQLQVGPRPDGKVMGGVRYLIRGAQRITLRIYTAKGTYVSVDSLGGLQLGSDSGVFSPALSSVSQARYNPADGLIYAYREGWQVLQQSSGGNYREFVPAPGFEGKGLIGYGVNLYAATGSGKIPLTLTRTAITHMEVEGQILCAEDFVCIDYPGAATALWVELNDTADVLQSKSGMSASLAWVNISGESLLTGPVESSAAPSSSQPESLEESASSVGSSASSSKQASSKSASSVPAAAGGGAATASKAPSANPSKFEGVITSSQPDSKASGKVSSSSPAPLPALPAAQTTLPEAPPEHSTGGPLIYQVNRPGQGAGPDWAMILYLVLVSCVILYLLLRPKNR